MARQLRPTRRPPPAPAAADAGRGRAAEAPVDIPGRGWLDILRRVRHALARDHMWLAAAAVAFCSLFAAIPGVAAVLALLGLMTDPAAVQRQLEMTRGLLPPAASGYLAEQMRAIASAGTLRVGTGLGGALLAALWCARIGVSTLVGAFNLAYRERETRGFLAYQGVTLAGTLVAGLFGVLAFALVAVLPATVDALPLGPGAKAALSLGRWPALALLTAATLAVAFRFGPSRRRPKWRWVAAGAAVATGLWLAGSALFSAYVARFGSYEQAFGALGTLMLLLSWFYLTAFAVLLGAELNAEMERQTGRDTTEGPERPLGRRGASVADTVKREEEDG